MAINNKTKKIKPFEELELKDDFMFRAVMTNPELCKECLERIMNIKIKELRYPQSEVNMDSSAYTKGIRIDVYTEGDGVVYDIEMQPVLKKDIPQRSRYYQSKIDFNNLKPGDKYSELKNNVVIFIGLNDLFGEGRHKYTFENRCVENPDIRLKDGTTKIFLNAFGTLMDISYDLEVFLNYIATGIVSDDYTKQLNDEVNIVRSNEKWRSDYMTMQTLLIEEHEEGKREEREENIRNLLIEGMDYKFITRITKATTEEIRSIESAITQEDRELYFKENGGSIADAGHGVGFGMK